MPELPNENLFEKLKTLLPRDNIPELGPGPRPGCETVAKVEEDVDRILTGAQLSDERRELIRGLALLWHDHLNESHRISQGIGSRDGSYLHGVMHRREPDYGNSKYWFHRAGPHPIFPELAEEAGRYLKSVGNTSLPGLLMPADEWEPTAFVDACEEAASRPGTDETVRHLREIQRLEFDLLLRHYLESGE